LFEELVGVFPPAPSLLQYLLLIGVAACEVRVEDEEHALVSGFTVVHAQDGVSVHIASNHNRRALSQEVISELGSLSAELSPTGHIQDLGVDPNKIRHAERHFKRAKPLI